MELRTLNRDRGKQRPDRPSSTSDKHSWPNRPYTVLGYLDATTAPIRRRGAVSFAARRAKEFGADAIIVINSSAFTSGNLYNNGFTATTTGTGFSAPLFFGKAQVLAIKWK